MARPKNVIQKRDEKKYWLPDGIKLIADKGNPNYRKETVLIFEDQIHGLFETTFKALQDAGASTHPKAVSERRQKTNLEKYGCVNPSSHPEIKEKRRQTTQDRYGVDNPFHLDSVKLKSKNTLMNNYGVLNPMQSESIQKEFNQNLQEKYGVSNIFHIESAKENYKKTCMQNYGVENPSKSPIVVERIIKANIENASTGNSKMENSLRDYIRSLGFETKKGYVGGTRPGELDIVVKEKNIAFEFNGAYWHCDRDERMPTDYHLNKTIGCKNQGLRLIQIFDFEWKNRKNQVKSYIKSALGKNETIIFARKCEVVELNKEETNEFLDKYHILGKVHYKRSYGLKYNGELLSLVTIGLHHRNNTEWVLSRFCGKEGVSVVGGLSRLCKHAKSNHGEITTWVDLRFSDGSNWIKSGWSYIKTLRPDYFYLDTKCNKIVSKQSRQKKHIGTPNDLTERQHARVDGLYRIYDCGKIKLKY